MMEMSVVFEVLSRVPTVLVLNDRAGVDKMGKINEHSAGIGTLADYVFLERREEFMHLHGESVRFVCPLPSSFAVTCAGIRHLPQRAARRLLLPTCLL